jgi:hypothetical protein
MMLNQDFVIQSNVRRLLVRSSIDYTRIDIGTVRGVVYLGGVFRMSGINPDRYEARDESTTKDVSTLVKRQYEMLAKTLYTLERRVKGIPGVQDVVFQFSNWKKERGQWVAVKEVERKEREQ